MGDAQDPVAGRAVVVGVQPDQPLWVVQVAGEYARAFAAELVCVAADETRFAYQELPDGMLLSAPLDPDLVATGRPLPEPRIEEIREVLAALQVPWTMRQPPGPPADALMAVADEVGALMIVVGARSSGFRGALRAALAGSVAVRLAHRQYRPVVVVPTSPAESDDALLSGLG